MENIFTSGLWDLNFKMLMTRQGHRKKDPDYYL